jgi:hypothetical protein
VRFEGEEMDEEPPSTHERGTPWYFFVPPAIVGVWLWVAVARVVVVALVPAGVARAEDSGLLGDVLQGVDLLGGLGWVSLFVFYFALLSRRRRSRWWALGGLCCALTLPLYLALLFLPPHRSAVATPDLRELEPFGTEKRPRVASAGLRDSFVCDGCGSLLNYGVSECGDCGERYTYEAGRARIDDLVPRRR